MNSIEITGENVEEAIAKGLQELGVGPGDVIVEVLEEPSRGVFGLGARPAKVRLQVLVPQPPPPPVTETAGSQSNKTAAAGITAEDDPAEDDYYDDGEETIAVDELSADEDALVGKTVLAELLEKMNVEASIEVRRSEVAHPGEDSPWLLNVSGVDMSVLIGRRGETLASLQYITRLIASRRLERRANIVVDVDGYKSRRSSQLRKLALRMADQAIEQNRTVSMEPMPPNERRIIHMTLRSRSDVITKSIGEGDSRKVTIVPK